MSNFFAGFRVLLIRRGVVFEQSLIEDRSRRVSSRALAASVFVQLSFLAVAALIPLFYTAELPIGRLLTQSWLLAPPPEASPAVAPPTPIERFEVELQQPPAIPDQVAIIDDGADAPAPRLSQPVGVVRMGGVADGYSSGVFGMGRLSLSDVVPPQRIRRGGRVQEALLLERVPPVYPAEAIEQSISGLVLLEAIIGVDGSIHQVKVISGDPLLAASTLDAVRQWRYRPTQLNGTAVEVITRIEVTFRFQPSEAADSEQRKKEKNS